MNDLVDKVGQGRRSAFLPRNPRAGSCHLPPLTGIREPKGQPRINKTAFVQSAGNAICQFLGGSRWGDSLVGEQYTPKNFRRAVRLCREHRAENINFPYV